MGFIKAVLTQLIYKIVKTTAMCRQLTLLKHSCMNIEHQTPHKSSDLCSSSQTIPASLRKPGSLPHPEHNCESNRAKLFSSLACRNRLFLPTSSGFFS